MPTLSATTRQPGVLDERRLARLRAVVFAVAGTVAVWVAATAGLGIELRAPAFDEGAGNPEIGVGMVASATLVGGIGGWALLALAERLFGARGRAVWLALAIAALLVSFGGPFSGTGVGDATRLTLASMHVVAASILIPLLYRSSRGHGAESASGGGR